MKKYPLLPLICKKNPQMTKDHLFSLILTGKVSVCDEVIRDSKRLVNAEALISIHMVSSFVSRGGDKLNGVLEEWQWPIENKTVLDAGCSTGGFTDCLLSRGASRVIAVDVGYNQLDYKLRTDIRVDVRERCNVMSLSELSPIPQGAVADLSFRSIVSAADKILNLVSDDWLIALVKPQFEKDKGDDSFDGIIRDQNEIFDISCNVMEELKRRDIFVHLCSLSKVRGRKGNQELFFLLRRQNTGSDQSESIIHHLKLSLDKASPI